MTTKTYEALLALAQALTDNPEDARELAIYGGLPMHLDDCINDYASEDAE